MPSLASRRAGALFRAAMLALSTLLLCATAPAASTRFVTLGAGATAGLYYPTAETMAKLVNDAKLGVRVGVRATGGSVFNAQGLEDDALQLAILQNNVAYFAYRGQGIAAFANKPARHLRGLATLYPEVLHIVARKGTGIGSPADLKGRVVYVGDIGSGAEQDAIAVLGAYGLTLADLKTAVRGSAGNAVNLLRDGKIDALMFTVGIGSAAIAEAAQTTSIEFVPIAPAKIAELRARYPYYSGTAIGAGAYPGVDTATPAIAVQAMLAASDRLPAREVDRLMHTLFDTRLKAFLDQVPNPNLKASFKLEHAVEAMPIPLHEGAVAFYRSVGVAVPASLLAH